MGDGAVVAVGVEPSHSRVLEGQREQAGVGPFDGRPLVVQILEFLGGVRNVRTQGRGLSNERITAFLLEVLRVENGTGQELLLKGLPPAEPQK